MKQEEYEKINEKTYHNKIELQKVKYCGCLCCGTLFYPHFILEWIDEGEGSCEWTDKGMVRKDIETQYTAKCSYCKSDDILSLGNDKEEAKHLLKEILVYECQDNIVLKERFEYSKENGEERVIIHDKTS